MLYSYVICNRQHSVFSGSSRNWQRGQLNKGVQEGEQVR
jgi:hypothetical protein